MEWLQDRQPETEYNAKSIENEFDVTIKFPTAKKPTKYLILKGTRLGVTKACKNINYTIKQRWYTDPGAELRKAQEDLTEEESLPNKIWPAGYVLLSVDLGPCKILKIMDYLKTELSYISIYRKMRSIG